MLHRGKGLDNLFLAGGRPRYRRWYPTPAGLTERRVIRDLAEPGAVSHGGTLQQVRTATTTAIAQFVGEDGNCGRALVVTAAPGTGKSTALAASVKRRRVEARIVVGTKLLAREQAERYGYNLIEGRNRRNCERYDVVRALGEAGHPVEALACGTPFEPRCQFRAGCAYFAQFGWPGPWVGTTEQLFNNLFLQGASLAVVDDADLPRALVRRARLTGEALERAEEQLADPGYDAERALLRVVQHTLIDAPGSWSTGGHAWDLLAATAARLGLDLGTLVESLPKRESLPAPYEDDDGYLSVRTVAAVPPASVAVLLAALRLELEAFRTNEDFNSYIRIRKGEVEVASLRSHIEDKNGVVIARVPLLVLDATPMHVLVDHLTALHERQPDVAGEVALPPNVTVVQYATGTSGFSALRSDAEVARVLSEIEQERRTLPCEASDEALIVYKSALPRFEAAGFAHDRILTFGSARGTNSLARVRRLHVVGRPHPPLEDTFFLAQVIHHDEPVVSPELVLRSGAFGGRCHGVDFVDYVDPRMAALLKAAREDELVQVLHRARLLTLESQRSMNGDEREGVRLVLHSSHPLPGLRVDQLIRAEERERWNEGRQAEARQRIEQAIARLQSAGQALTRNAIAAEAKASKRTVSAYLGTRDHTPLDESSNPWRRSDVGTEDHTSIENTLDEHRGANQRLDDVGTKDHTPLKESPWGVILCPHTLSGSVAPATRREPCRGGCGVLMPAGQKCFECASRAVAEWKLARAGNRRTAS